MITGHQQGAVGTEPESSFQVYMFYSEVERARKN